MRKLRQINWTFVTVKTIVTLFMMGAAGISFTHIIDVSHTLGLGVEAYSVPFFIDGFAVLGLIGRSHRFAESTRRAGLKITASMGLLSLVCNVMAGNNLGQRLYGVLVVGVFVYAEWYSGKLIAAPKPAPSRKLDPAVAAERAAKAAITRKANEWKAMTPAQKRAHRKAAQVADQAESYANGRVELSVAPVSPLVGTVR